MKRKQPSTPTDKTNTVVRSPTERIQKILDKIEEETKKEFEFLDPDTAKIYECAICLEVVFDTRACDNGHLFCKKCCENETKCPMCKTETNKWIECPFAERQVNNLLVQLKDMNCMTLQQYRSKTKWTCGICKTQITPLNDVNVLDHVNSHFHDIDDEWKCSCGTGDLHCLTCVHNAGFSTDYLLNNEIVDTINSAQMIQKGARIRREISNGIDVRIQFTWNPLDMCIRITSEIITSVKGVFQIVFYTKGQRYHAFPPNFFGTTNRSNHGSNANRSTVAHYKNFNGKLPKSLTVCFKYSLLTR